MGLKAVAKTALMPPIRPSTATLSSGAIEAIWVGSRTEPTPM